MICEICAKDFQNSDQCIKNSVEKYNKILCRSCRQKEQYRLGLRKSHFTEMNVSNKGKTFEDRFGVERSNEISEKRSNLVKGDKNPNFGSKTGFGTKHNSYTTKGKTFEELYGVEKANSMKKRISENHTGEKNFWFGKPSPIGSGNGWSGWYKGWYFRSLLELSFMIKVIERFNFSWKSAESKEYKIFYKIGEKTHSYVADFILNDKLLVEIKPKKLQNSFVNKLKKEAAIVFCDQHSLKYKVTEVAKISICELKLLVDSDQVKFIDRYQQKFNKLIEDKYTT